MGAEPATMIDVGAEFGDWSEMCRQLLPDASYLMIEPLEEFEPFLTEKVARFGNFRYVPAVAASRPGSREIHVHPDLSGSSLFEEDEELTKDHSREVTATTLDVEVSNIPRPSPPYLVKIDVQGAELEILEGATEVLRDCEIVVLETSLFKFFSAGRNFAT
ncbi:MAG: FkbM family methyltransferase [Actinomycetota bacterium]